MEDQQRRITQSQFALLNCTSPRTVGWRLSRHGSYYGTPLKLANGHNLWPATQVLAKSTGGSK
jgi:hypothetical protein